MERFNLRKLNELEIRKQYQTETANSFDALEELSDSEGINRAWENIKENSKISSKEMKQHKPRFDEECLRFYIKGNAKMQ